MFELAGRKDAAAAAKRVMDVRDPARQGIVGAACDLRDVDKVYNPFDVAGATKATPGVDWARWLAAMGIEATTS